MGALHELGVEKTAEKPLKVALYYRGSNHYMWVLWYTYDEQQGCYIYEGRKDCYSGRADMIKACVCAGYEYQPA